MENQGQETHSIVVRLMDERAKASDLVNAIRGARLGSAPSKEVWLASVGAVALFAAELEWLSRRDRAWVWACMLAYVVRSLTESRAKDSPTETETKAALLPFLDWLKSQPDRTVVGFCWDVLAFHPRSHGAYETYPIHWLRRAGRLGGEITHETIECAISLADEAEAMYWWPDERWQAVRWDRDSEVYVNFLSDSSYLVRATAAKALGELWWGCCQKAQGGSVAPFSEVMRLVESQQQRRAGVAGPFLQGSHWSCGELMKALPEYDFRNWFLQALRASSEEPDVPHVQTLEFYAHEYFCGDANAIEELLQMGRYRLAVETATEEPANIERLKSVLDSMAQSDQPGVAQAIRRYLVEREHHAGLELMPE